MHIWRMSFALVVGFHLCGRMAVFGADHDWTDDLVQNGGSVLLSVDCTNEALPRLLGRILCSIPSATTQQVPSIKLLLRNTAVGAVGPLHIYKTTDLIACAGRDALINDKPNGHTPRITLSLRNVTIERALRIIAPVVGFRLSVQRNGFELGPAELVGERPTLERRSYMLLPKTVIASKNAIAAQLESTGSSVAYDSKNGVLDVICDPTSIGVIESILFSMGAKHLHPDECDAYEF